LDFYAAGLLLLGFLVGTLNASTGVGWGIIMIPTLFMIPFLSARQAVAVSTVAYLFNGLTASFENIRNGLIVWKYAAFLAAGGILGGWLGAYLLRHLPTAALKRAVGVIVIAAGVNLLLGRSG